MTGAAGQGQLRETGFSEAIGKGGASDSRFQKFRDLNMNINILISTDGTTPTAKRVNASRIFRSKVARTNPPRDAPWTLSRLTNRSAVNRYAYRRREVNLMLDQNMSQALLAWENLLSGSGFGDVTNTAIRERGWIDQDGRPTEDGRRVIEALSGQNDQRSVFRHLFGGV